MIENEDSDEICCPAFPAMHPAQPTGNLNFQFGKKKWELLLPEGDSTEVSHDGWMRESLTIQRQTFAFSFLDP